MKWIKDFAVYAAIWMLMYFIFLITFTYLVINASTPEMGFCEIFAIIAAFVVVREK